VVPSKGKWTKLYPALFWHFVGLTMGAVPHLVPRAFAHLDTQCQTQAAPARQGPAAAADGVYLQDVSWHEVQGSRYRSFVGGLEDERRRCLLVLATLILQPVAWVTQVLLTWSSRPRRRQRQLQGQPNLLQVLCSPERSPFVVAAQYLSAMAEGELPRCSPVRGREPATPRDLVSERVRFLLCRCAGPASWPFRALASARLAFFSFLGAGELARPRDPHLATGSRNPPPGPSSPHQVAFAVRPARAA
jgi:hypothetical protein